MDLQEMLDGAAKGDVAHVAEGWGQGRATYGGLVAGLQLAAVTGRLGPDRAPLRSLTASFVAPVEPGEASIEVDVLRAGSRATQAASRLSQDGTVRSAVLASFGRGRDSTVAVGSHEAMPDLPAPGTVEPMPYAAGLMPDFLAHVELTLVDGGWPYSGADTSHMTGWMRFRQAPPHFGEEHLVGLADAWPPAVVQMLDAPAPASSLTWTLELVDDLTADPPAPDTHWAYGVRTDHAADGYAHTHARIWRPDGRLVAISRQTVAVFG